MGSKAAEIAEEQKYFDQAYRRREAARTAAHDAAMAAAHPAAATQLRRRALAGQTASGTKTGEGEAVAVGRMDTADGERLYVGRRLIRDEDAQVLVINWQAPAAAPFYQASHRDPMGLPRKRTFECTGNNIENFTDITFMQAGGGLSGPDADILRELARGRTGRMRDIVATIQAAQLDLIRAPLEQVLVIEGGPGTGKTAIGLHRVSWLLFNHPDQVNNADVLVVGPHPTFTTYIRTVLPSLGDVDVAQVDITQLAPQVHRGRTEAAEVSRLKGDARMAGLIARALDARIGRPEPAERLQVGGRYITVPGVEIAEAVASCRTADGPYAQRRLRLRELLAQLVANRGVAPVQGRQASLDNLVERLWPQLSASAFLSDLLSSRERLLVAAGDELTAAETIRLRRRSADRLSHEIWSRDDLPLLDEADDLISGSSRRYAHIVVDEAQDLSPMQLRSVARRSATGSLTVLGDLAQSTGMWARDSWDDVTAHLPATRPRTVVSLRYGYRVPRQVYELAAQLLPVAAPDVIPPDVVRDGPAAPGVHRVDPAERAGRVVSLAVAHADKHRFVGIICPADQRAELESALAANDLAWSSADRGELGYAINLVSPQEAKGLEFDAVIVLEPEEIVAGDERGHRLLYVALTRTVGYLDIVCAGHPLPLSPVEPSAIAGIHEAKASPPPVATTSVVDLAQEIAARVRAQSPAPQWDAVLSEVHRLLRLTADETS